MAKTQLTGRRFNMLEVLAEAPQRRTPSGQKPRYFVCRCDCGTVSEVSYGNLVSGAQVSCGCHRRAQTVHRNKTRSEREKAAVGAANTVRARRRHGAAYRSSADYWYKRAYLLLRGAEVRGIPVRFGSPLELANYLADLPADACPVFGTSLVPASTDLKHRPSVDRIDSERGYEPGNLQIISVLANRMKTNATPAELEKFARWVLEEKT